MKQTLLERFRGQKPFDDFEVAIVSALLASHVTHDPRAVSTIRYALNFARLSVFRNSSGRDINVFDDLHAFRIELNAALEACARSGQPVDLNRVLHEANTIRRMVHDARARLLRQHVNNFNLYDLDAEVCNKVLAVVSGGGGGSGYVYLGAFQALEEAQLAPRLIIGTSMGSIIGLLRAVSRRFDIHAMSELTTRLRWNDLFEPFSVRTKYGFPGLLRLRLHKAFRDFFFNRDAGRVMRLSELAIPFETVVAGIKVGALQRNIDDYDRLFAGASRREIGAASRLGLARGAAFQAMQVIRDFIANPSMFREITLGHDEDTRNFDALDAAGFSSSVPAVLHYDMDRDDDAMKRQLDTLFEQQKIVRLVDGGVINNVPARAAWESIQRGRCIRRNAVILAMDSFAPKPWLSPIWVPLQRLAAENVRRNLPFAQVHKTFRYTLSPLDLVPNVAGIRTAVVEGVKEVSDDVIPLLAALMTPLDGLENEYAMRRDAPGRDD